MGPVPPGRGRSQPGPLKAQNGLEKGQAGRASALCVPDTRWCTIRDMRGVRWQALHGPAAAAGSTDILAGRENYGGGKKRERELFISDRPFGQMSF